MTDDVGAKLRDQFWGAYQDRKYQEIYLDQYLLLTSRILLAIDVFTALFAAGGIASWWTWAQGRWAWTILIAASQIVQLIKPFLPFSKRAVCVRFFLADIKQLTVDMCNEWNRLECSPSENGYRQAIRKFEQRYTSLDNKFLAGEAVPEMKYLVERSWDIWNRFLRGRFGIEGRRYENAEHPIEAQQSTCFSTETQP